MNFNLTLIGQSVAFAMFVWFCIRFVWPPVITALRERQKQIADGLAAAQRGEMALEVANQEKEEILADARSRAQEIVDQARQRAEQMVEEAKNRARDEGRRQVQAAEAEIEQVDNRIREEVRKDLAQLVINATEQVLQREVNAETHEKLLNELARSL